MNFLEKKRLKYNINPLKSVMDDPYKLEFIDKENQTEDVSLITVKENGFLIKYVKNITPKICLEAIGQVMGRDFKYEYEEELINAARENNNEMLEIIVDKDCIRLYQVDRNIPIWENEITEITLARTILNEYSERVFKELDAKIPEREKAYILEQLKYHRECLINGDIIIDKYGGCVLTIECNCCNKSIIDSDYFHY